MKDEDMTKEQLINELAKLRQRVLELERSETERKRAEEALRKANLEILEAVSLMVEVNDPYTSGHSEGVTNYALAIAKRIGIANSEIETLRVAGLLHDIGKIGIPSAVLNKPAPLTSAEWAMIKAHPDTSARIVEKIEAFKEAIPLIRHHHEWYNGLGYPSGLREEEIPLGSRILAVADGLEAMTSDRPYRQAMSLEKTLSILKGGAGEQWDPQIVKITQEVVG
jgi:putative nucleotidyltransferase with HDIG domain